MISKPVVIYNNWSAYDELSDNVELTEELAMRQLDELLRLRGHGIRFDYYLMDAFWFAPDGGYRTWRKPHWPNGPDRWLEKCLANGIQPGLWVGTNGLCKLVPVPGWQDSLAANGSSMCLFDGGFLSHFTDSLQGYYDRGVRAFKFDFANFGAATPEAEARYSPDEIFERNVAAFRGALSEFRERNPEALLLAYNGFGGEIGNTSVPMSKTVDEAWLTVFDSLYCGDPRPSDVPAMDFWRSKDIYSDHMVRYYEFNGIPLHRIDNCAFMIGTTGTCYKRGTAAWKGMLLLTLARGGWANFVYGNLELLDEVKAEWFARVQSMFLPMQANGCTRTFGGVPGRAEPYGYLSADGSGSLCTVVNPSQCIAEIEVPEVGGQRGTVLFRDAGFAAQVRGNVVTLGPEQLALVGHGGYASDEFDLGLQEDVIIPLDIQPIPASFAPDGKNSVSATTAAPEAGDLRIVMRLLSSDERAVRISGGAPPAGTPMGQVLRITARQQGRECPVEINYDKAIWSGLSWAVGEVKAANLAPREPVTIRCEYTHDAEARIEAAAYAVVHGGQCK
mgnify:CR=1 FL=1